MNLVNGFGYTTDRRARVRIIAINRAFHQCQSEMGMTILRMVVPTLISYHIVPSHSRTAHLNVGRGRHARGDRPLGVSYIATRK